MQNYPTPLYDYNDPNGKKKKLFERFLLLNRKRVMRLTFRFLLVVALLFVIWWPFIKDSQPEPDPFAKKEELEVVKKTVDSILKAHNVAAGYNIDSLLQSAERENTADY